MFDRKTEKMLSEHTRLPDNGGDPNRPQILRLNELMRNEVLNNDLGDGNGYLALQIPEPDMRVLEIRFPELISPDHEIKLKAWQKFMASPESEPYKVRRNDGKRLRSV